jgi:hypothetical protein
MKPSGCNGITHLEDTGPKGQVEEILNRPRKGAILIIYY